MTIERYEELKKSWKPQTNLRFGQYVCNQEMLHDPYLFYQTSVPLAENHIWAYYVHTLDCPAASNRSVEHNCNCIYGAV